MVIVTLLTFASKAASLSTSEVTRLLHKAEQIKASAPEQSRAILTSLNDVTLTAYQQDYHDYLTGFHLAINSNIPAALDYLEPVSRRRNDDEVGLRTRATLLSLYAGVKDWSKGLLIADELEVLLQDLPETQAWHVANIGTGNFYNKLGMYQQAFDLLNDGYQNQSEQIDPVLRCRYATQRMNALQGLTASTIQPSLFRELAALCLPLPPSVYTREFPILWSRYQVQKGQYDEALRVSEEYETAIKQLDYFYYWVAFRNNQAEALFALNQIDDARRVVDELLAQPNLVDYRMGFTRAAKLKIKLALLNNDYATAYHWRSELAVRLRLQFDEETEKALAVFQAKAMLDSAEVALALRVSHKALLAQEVKLAEKRVINNYLLLGLVCAALMFVGGIFYRLLVQKNRLQRLASRDALTGLYSRRHLFELAERATKNSRGDVISSVVLIDLDGLKQINDRFGHPAGDIALQQVASAIIEQFGKVATCCARMGGGRVYCLL